MQYRVKKASYPKCPITGQRLAGIKALRPTEYSNKRMSKRQKTVNRVYGGCLSHGVVRERIVRAFLLEEQKIVKKVRRFGWFSGGLMRLAFNVNAVIMRWSAHC